MQLIGVQGMYEYQVLDLIRLSCGRQKMSNITNGVETITLNVSGMTCGSCERHIKKALHGVPGYQDAKVDLPGGRVLVTYEPGTATTEQLADAVTRAGYPAEPASTLGQTQSDAPKSYGCCATRNS